MVSVIVASRAVQVRYHREGRGRDERIGPDQVGHPARLRALVDQCGGAGRSMIEQQPPHVGQYRRQVRCRTRVHDREEELLVGDVDDVARGRAVQDGTDGAGTGHEALIPAPRHGGAHVGVKDGTLHCVRPGTPAR
jgi:hypothetical protein